MSASGGKVCPSLNAACGDAVSPFTARHSSVPTQRGIPLQEKPLLYHLFAKCSYKIAADEVHRRERHPSSNALPAILPTSAPTAEGDVATSPYLCAVLQLDPAGIEPQRFSTRSGRQLNECESLHEKHKQEYCYISRVLSEALKGVVTAHSEWSQQQQVVNAARGAAAAAGRDNHESEEGTNGTAMSRSSTSLFEGFVTSEVPHILLADYITRLVRFTYASPAVLVIACLYLDRLLLLHDTLLLTDCTVFKLFTVALRISSKMYDTRTLSNKDFAHIAGVTAEDLGVLETDFLCALRFDLYISAEEFNGYSRDIVLAAEKGEMSTSSPRSVVSVNGSTALSHGGRFARRSGARRLDSGSATSFASRSSGPAFSLANAAGPAPPGISTTTVSYVSMSGESTHTALASEAGGSVGVGHNEAPAARDDVAGPVRRRTSLDNGSRSANCSTAFMAAVNNNSNNGKPPKAGSSASRRVSGAGRSRGGDVDIVERLCGDGILANDSAMIPIAR